MKINEKDFRVPPGKDRSQKVADAREAGLQVEEEIPQTPRRAGGGVELAATSALRVKRLCDTADFSGHGRRRQRRRHPAGHVRVNPQGCQVFSFKQPSAEELEHDFLWRTTKRLPERGRIGIFNRSYYEEVLIVRVHPEILRGQGLPDELLDEKAIWQERYRSVVDLEAHLHRNGTRIIKFMSAILSFQFLSGLSSLKRENCGHTRAHPLCSLRSRADDKKNARLIISEIILDVFNGLKMAYPKPGAKRRRELQSIRKRLLK